VRTVFTVDALGGPDVGSGTAMMMVKAERAPIMVPAAMQYRPFTLLAQNLPAWGIENAVRERGRLVRRELRKHPGLSTILDMLAHTPPGDVNPIYLKLAEGEAELITWETLCDENDQFLALDQRWPIGRITDPLSGHNRPPPVLRTPVKVLAVISAYGISGQKKEWEMLRDAAQAARAAQLDVRLRLLVGDNETYAAIKEGIDAGLDWVELSHVEKTGARVIQDIVAWAPNVVHFFCHGSAGIAPSDQAIELATASDYEAGSGGSVKIRVGQLAGLSSTLDNQWLLTLNCCSGGEATKELQSIAHQVVSAGCPAAVAMIEPVAACDAHEFTHAFYHRLFDELRRMVATLTQQEQASFEWAQALHDARTAICALHNDDAPNAREWALPVLYVRGVDPLPFQRPHLAVSEVAAAEFKLQARVIAGWLETVRGETSEERRLAVMAKALADVPKSYWPNVDGEFEHA
jgi:hypothetical protein